MLHPMERTEAEWQKIRECFTRTLVFNEERGRYASGVAVVQRDGTLHLFKQPVAASELVKTERYREVMAQVGPETTCLLGHARMPTKGTRWNNVNNHPLLVGHVVGIHNGHISNDDELFARFRLPRLGEVDSEIIFRLLDGLSPLRLNGSYLAEVRRRMTVLEGRFATLSVDLRRPRRLLVMKQGAPLCVHYHEPWQALWFSSRYLFLRKSFGRAVLTESLPSHYAYLFDAERLPELRRRPVAAVALAGFPKREVAEYEG